MFTFRQASRLLLWIMTEMSFLRMVKYFGSSRVHYTILEFLNLIGRIGFRK